jgi:hypothetical protein
VTVSSVSVIDYQIRDLGCTSPTAPVKMSPWLTILRSSMWIQGGPKPPMEITP